MSIRRILGNKGRTTIPYEFRINLGMTPNDVLDFELDKDRNAVIVTKAKLCDNCTSVDIEAEEKAVEEMQMDLKMSLAQLINQLPSEMDEEIFKMLILKNPELPNRFRKAVKRWKI